MNGTSHLCAFIYLWSLFIRILTISSKEVELFISVTSAPLHAHLREAIRETWLKPCITSPLCDYYFFVDILPSNDTMEMERWTDLIEERNIYHDIAFRNSCELMNRHPKDINYGNSPPVSTNKKDVIINIGKRDGKPITKEIEDLPDYKYRRLYKIDWKVCFLRFSKLIYSKINYHVFVEDDSFVCTNNLLYQILLLSNQNKNSTKLIPFRTGTRMYDGFDDSSTFMSGEIADIFEKYYGSKGFDCAEMADMDDKNNPWLSWGNSWIYSHCDWSKRLKDNYKMDIIKPYIHCMTGSNVINHNNIEIEFPCMKRPLILHHGSAAQILLVEDSKQKGYHMCEYMLLIDKIKNPSQIHHLWNMSIMSRNYHDFSNVFRYDNSTGWLLTMNQLAQEEIECRQQYWHDTNNSNNNSSLNQTKPDLHESCLFDRDLEVSKRYLYENGINSENKWNRKNLIYGSDYWLFEWKNDIL
eukprot:gene8517-11514_t